MIKFIWQLLFGRPCKHEWKLLYEHKEPSFLERIPHGGRFEEGSISMTEGKHIQVFTCPKCGEIKRYVESV